MKNSRSAPDTNQTHLSKYRNESHFFFSLDFHRASIIGLWTKGTATASSPSTTSRPSRYPTQIWSPVPSLAVTGSGAIRFSSTVSPTRAFYIRSCSIGSNFGHWCRHLVPPTTPSIIVRRV